MPNLVKSNDVRSGRRAEVQHGRHGSQWVKGASTFIKHVFLGTKVSYLLNKFSSSVDPTVIETVCLALQPISIYASSRP